MTVSPSFQRLIPAVAGGMLFLLLAMLWLSGATDLYTTILHFFGVAPFRFPFVDAHGVVTAIECSRRGVDVYIVNPCDVLGRLHVYSPLWLRLGVLPIDASWSEPLGLLTDLGFLASLVLLPVPRHMPGTLVLALGVLSPAVIFAMERANVDLLIFILAMLTGYLAIQSQRLRLLSYPLIVLAASLKFYPVTLMILVWREHWLRCLLIVTLSVAGIAACLLPDKDDLLRVLHMVQAVGGTIGAAKLPTGVVTVFHMPSWCRLLIQGLLTLAMAIWALRLSYRLQPALRHLSEAERVFLIIGSALMAGCFLAGENFGYRAIYLLFVLPALVALAAEATDNVARTTVVLVVVAMWGDALRATPGMFDHWLYFAQQCAWWIVITVLLACLLAMLRDSTAIETLRGFAADRLWSGKQISRNKM